MSPIYLLTSAGLLVAFGPGMVLFPKFGSVMVGNTNGESGWEINLCSSEKLAATEVIFKFAKAIRLSPAGAVLRWNDEDGSIEYIGWDSQS